MSRRKFSLIPFPDEKCDPGLAITGSIARRANALTVAYELRGDLTRLSIPPRADAPARRDGLWQETCLELFVGADGSAAYREFNLSPAGHWNVYRFDSYREGMREEASFASLPFTVRLTAGAFRLSLDVDIGALVPAGSAADVAVCAVVQMTGGELGHWALAHPGPRPDFHRRDGFALRP